MSNEGQTFTLPKKSSLVADLFTTQEQRDNDKREKVMIIPISEIDDFPDQPFQVRMDEAMTAMVESVKTVGIQTPAIARQKEDGRYELISGHRRKMAATLAGLETMPVIVRELSRDEAIIALVDANLQREVILPSEKAKSYQMKLDALKRQGNRTDLTSCPVGTKFRTDELVAEKTDDSARQVQRFIRLNSLVPEVLQMVDEGKIAFRTAVELSYLSEKEQTNLLDMMQAEDSTPSLAQAIKLKHFSQEGRLNENVVMSIMSEEGQPIARPILG
jgi:ParB family chromosome partitioning protein